MIREKKLGIWEERVLEGMIETGMNVKPFATLYGRKFNCLLFT
jgi:hypothetical protein